MADSWYEFSNMDHFWIQRRFEVMDRILRIEAGSNPKELKWLDVGCGAGLLQQFCETKYQLKIDGADLNVVALAKSTAEMEHNFCYNIHDRKSDFAEFYDILSVLDVIEHIPDEGQFLESLLFHIKMGGYLLVNVPAFKAFYSKYDIVAGHVRRYSQIDVSRICNRHELRVVGWSYWGMGLLPVLLMRNLLVSCVPDKKVIEKGFSTNALLSSVLFHLSRMEMFPNHFLGTSLMFLLKKTIKSQKS